MSLLKRLFSAFTSSVDNTISELSEHTNNTNKIEVNTPTVEKSTSTPDNNSDGIISKYVFSGEIKSGTQIMVSSGEILVVIKDGTIVNLLPTGIYVLDDSNVSDFATGSAYTISLKESEKFKWGTINPINFNDNQYGMLALRVRGTYSYKICDVVKFVTDYMKAGNIFSVNDHTKSLLINAVEKAIYNCNGISYTQLSTADIGKFVENELKDIGINFIVNIEMITLAQESEAVIKQAMQNKNFNNQ
ncbi:MAG: SPFH domain-containing protein [Acutalibacteraceae bacterium]|nr:SPFH domain-containing protein [Acutalibacteraceae bacterium]